MHYFNFIEMNVGQNFECCWKYSIFCRNSLILKWRNQKKNWHPNFSWYYEGMLYLNFIGMKVGQNFECCWKYSILSKFLNFKGVSPRKKGRNPKKNLKFSWCDEGCINLTFSSWTMCKILSVVGNIQFFVEILTF